MKKKLQNTEYPQKFICIILPTFVCSPLNIGQPLQGNAHNKELIWYSTNFHFLCNLYTSQTVKIFHMNVGDWPISFLFTLGIKPCHCTTDIKTVEHSYFYVTYFLIQKISEIDFTTFMVNNCFYKCSTKIFYNYFVFKRSEAETQIVNTGRFTQITW